MPAVHGHDDDFLFQIQYPAEPSSPDKAKIVLERTVRRVRNGRKINIYVPFADASFWAEILRTLKKYWRQ